MEKLSKNDYFKPFTYNLTDSTFNSTEPRNINR